MQFPITTFETSSFQKPSLKHVVSKYPHSNKYFQKLLIPRSNLEILAFRQVFSQYGLSNKQFPNTVTETSSFQILALEQVVYKCSDQNKQFANNIFQTSSFQIASLKEVVSKYCLSNNKFPKTFFQTNSFRIPHLVKSLISFFKTFLLLLSKFSVSEENWVLCCHSMKHRFFLDFSYFSRIVNLGLFVNSRGNLYLVFLLLIITLRFPSGERKIW